VAPLGEKVGVAERGRVTDVVPQVVAVCGEGFFALIPKKLLPGPAVPQPDSRAAWPSVTRAGTPVAVPPAVANSP